jgi:hypothetical protein
VRWQGKSAASTTRRATGMPQNRQNSVAEREAGGETTVRVPMRSPQVWTELLDEIGIAVAGGLRAARCSPDIPVRDRQVGSGRATRSLSLPALSLPALSLPKDRRVEVPAEPRSRRGAQPAPAKIPPLP